MGKEMASIVHCEIRIKGHLAPRWSEWFGGLDIEARPNGEGVLAGALPDQAALYGVLDRLRDLGIALISVRCDIVQDPDSEQRSRWTLSH